MQSVPTHCYTGGIISSAMRKYPPNNLRAIRSEAGLTLEQLAERVRPQTNHDMIAKLENGKRELTHTWMNRLADALRCAPEDFIISAAKTEERHLIAKYRGMSETAKAKFIGYMDGLADNEPDPSPRKRGETTVAESTASERKGRQNFSTKQPPEMYAE